MLIKFKSFIQIKDYGELGQKFFYIGIFFLPSAIFISGLFLITSIFISLRSKNIELLRDKWNYPLYIALLLVIYSTFNNTFINIPNNELYLNKAPIFFSTFNWIPLFFAYFGFQKYLRTYLQRELFLKFLISGSIPVFFSCIIQILNIFGPFKSSYGLIVWFNKPFSEVGGLTGLFSNPNYLGQFLLIILPFIIYFIRTEEKSLFIQINLLIYLFLTIYFSISTNSRNALIGTIISLFYLISSTKIKKLFSFLSIFCIAAFLFNPISKKIIEININGFCSKYQQFSICQIHRISHYSPRIEIWNNALKLIKERPLWGWGGSTFKDMYNSIDITSVQTYTHSHNLPLEIAYSFGIPASLIICSTVILIFLKTLSINIFNKNENNNNLLNQAWLISSFSFMFTHLSDVTYYDGKISILFVLLVAGLRNILIDNKI